MRTVNHPTGAIHMRINLGKKLAFVAASVALLAVGFGGGVAEAGRGGSPQAIQLAIASGSPDAIKAELERAESWSAAPASTW